MTYKQVALVLKLFGFIYFISCIGASTVAILLIFQNKFINPDYAGLWEDKFINPIIQMIIPNILVSLKFLLLGILTGTTSVCIARYLTLIRDEKTA
jgi:hypothetical protein